MKKGIVLSLALLMPAVGLSVHNGHFTPGPFISQKPIGSDWKSIMPHQGSVFLGIVTQAEDLQDPQAALKEIQTIPLKIKTNNATVNNFLKELVDPLMTIQTAENAEELVQVLLPLHHVISMLPMEVKAADADESLQKGFEKLQKAVFKIILLKAEKLQQQIMKLRGPAKQKATEKLLALIYVLTGGADQELLEIQTKALDIKDKAFKDLTAANQKAVQKAIQEAIHAAVSATHGGYLPAPGKGPHTVPVGPEKGPHTVPVGPEKK